MNKYTLKRWIENPWQIGTSMARKGLLDCLSDKAYLSIMYRANFGKKLNWKNPVTFNEKLQWLKLYDRKSVYRTMVDKFESKQYVAERAGWEYVVPVVGGPWDSFDEIDFDTLPERFVLKTTHDCGGVWICKDKASLDHAAARRFIETHLKNNYYLHCREWPYKDVKPRVFAEQYLENSGDRDLREYKFFCFDGVPRLMFVASQRQDQNQETKFDFFDMEFHHLPIINGHPNSDCEIECPAHFAQMKQIAAELSQGIPHLRVDLYEASGQIYVGELTFSHWGGFVPFEPEAWDEQLGAWLTLPEV